MLKDSQLLAYFNKIGFKEGPEQKLEPTLELLTQLHELHVFSIPFENLSIHTNQDIPIDIGSIFKKLVESQRGGYCHEMNGLFYAVLKKLGFDVHLHLAEVIMPGQALGSREARHAMLMVSLNGKTYLADVGFGRNGLIHPLALETENCEQKQIYSTLFDLKYEAKYGFVYGVHFNGSFHAEYRFDFPIKRELRLSDLQAYSDGERTTDFAEMILVSMPSKEGRITLHNDILKQINPLAVEKTIIDTYAKYLDTLKSKFGIRFGEKETLCFSKIPTLREKMEPPLVNASPLTGPFSPSWYAESSYLQRNQAKVPYRMGCLSQC